METLRTGLRERKKLATRTALETAAIRLTIRDGFDEVTIDDIADAAGVSPRTFSNYFSSKEAAVLASATDMSEHIAANFEARPAHEELWASLRAAVTAALTDPEPERGWMVELQLISGTHALLTYQLSTMARIETRLAAEVARRTGMSTTGDLYPALAAATVTAVTRTAALQWLDRGSTARLVDVVDEAFEHIRVGMSRSRPVVDEDVDPVDPTLE